MNLNYQRSFLMLCFGIGLLNLTACKEDKKPTSVKTEAIRFEKEGELQLKKADTDSILMTLAIEIADDDYQTQTGLMYRDGMKTDEGMLFIFPDEDYRSFYMKNTKFPLDIIYIAEDKSIINIQKNAQPMNETSLPSRGPAKYVLEVNAGLTDTWGLEAGDVMSFDTN